MRAMKRTKILRPDKRAPVRYKNRSAFTRRTDSSRGSRAREGGCTVFAIQVGVGASHQIRQNHYWSECGKRQLRTHLLRRTGGVVRRSHDRRAGFCRNIHRGPVGRWPHAVRRIRQLLAEYAPNATVFIADSKALDRIREFSMQELLPNAFLGVIKSG